MNIVSKKQLLYHKKRQKGGGRKVRAQNSPSILWKCSGFSQLETRKYTFGFLRSSFWSLLEREKWRHSGSPTGKEQTLKQGKKNKKSGWRKRATCWAVQWRAVHHVGCWLMSVGWLVGWLVAVVFFSMEKSEKQKLHTGRLRPPPFPFPPLHPPSKRSLLSSGMCEKDFLHRMFEKPKGTTRWVWFVSKSWKKKAPPGGLLPGGTVKQGPQRKKEGYFGVGIFLSHLSPPRHRPIRHTPQPHHTHTTPSNLLLPHVVIFSPKVGNKESISRWFFLAGIRKKKGTTS